jgi:hypothetical protein
MNPECPKCESNSTRRVARSKPLKDRLMYFFGMFPWECVDCHERFFSSKRYSRSKRNSMGEVYTDATSAPAVKPGSEESRSQ